MNVIERLQYMTESEDTEYSFNVVKYKDGCEYQFVSPDKKVICSMNYYIYKKKNFDWIYIADVETDPHYRCKGLANKLLSKMVSDLKSQYPDKGVYLRVKTDNEHAINLYKKNNFKQLQTCKIHDKEYFIMCKGNADEKQLLNTEFAS